MRPSNTKGKSAGGAVVSGTENTRLTGSWLIMARVVWLVLVVPSVGLFIASLLVNYRQMQTACVVATTSGNLSGELPIQVLQSLATIGFSASGFAALVTIFYALTAVIWYAVGFLLFWRRSDDWLALLAAFFLVMFNITSLGNTASALAFAYPLLALPLSLVDVLGQASLLVFFLLFPNGRLVPRWMGLILLLVIIDTFFSIFPSSTSSFNANNWPAWLNLLAALVAVGAIVFSQIYRFRRVSTPVQRQQTKWILLGVAAAIGIAIGIAVISPFIRPNSSTLHNLGGGILFFIIWPVALLLIPLSIGFSILRYRLYDIDVLINRTLVYGTLTLLLALLYVGLVLGLQFLFDRLTGSAAANSPLILVGSTLVIAALFRPFRQRIQNVIDRSFYRSKYDAAKIVARFSAALRQEVDLATLSEHLVAVVEETMQPAHVSLWLRTPQQSHPLDRKQEDVSFSQRS